MVGLELPGSLQNLDGEIAAAWTREAAASGQFGALAEQNPETFVEAMLRSVGGGRGGEIGLAMPLPSIALAGNWRGAATGTLLGGKVLLTKPGGGLPEPTPLVGPAKLPANDYAGGKSGLRGIPQRYDPEIKQWGTSTFTPKNPDLNKGLEPIGESEPRRGRGPMEVVDLDAQDEAARILQYAGFEVQTRDHRAGGGADYLIDGQQYEHYRINAGTPASAFDKIKAKIDGRQGQRFVVQLGDGAGFTLAEFRAYLQQWGHQTSKGRGLPAQQIIAIDGVGDIVVLWP